MSRLVCVSREPEGLVGLVLPEEQGASRLLRVPLAEVRGPGAEERASLLASWEHLGRARGATADTLTHVLRVLMLTVPGEPGPAPSLAHPWLAPPAPPHRRTAAHPRGYRGTLYQPPKRARPDVLDLRPYLLHRSTTRALLEPLRPHADAALRRLGDEGLSRERLSLVSQVLTFFTRADVALAWRHGVFEERAAELPASLLRLACLLTPGGAVGFGRLLALRGRLALDSSPEVMILAARLLATWGAETGLGWLEAAAPLVPESQRVLLESLFHPEVTAFEVRRYDPGFERFASRPREWRVFYFRGLAAGLTSEYLLSALRLLDTLAPSATYGLDGELPRSSGSVPEDNLLDLFAFANSSDSDTLLRLWALCGQLWDFPKLLLATPWRRWSVEVAWKLADRIAYCRWHVTRMGPREWSVLRRLHLRLLDWLDRIPASHQVRAIDMLFDITGDQGAKWWVPERLLSAAFTLTERLCQPPFATEDRVLSVLMPILVHPEPEMLRRLMAAPVRSLLRLQEGASRGNLVGLIANGMQQLFGRQASLVLDALDACPDVLVRTLGLIGTPHREVQEALLEDFARHPWMRGNPFELPLAELVASLREHCVDGVDSPLPRKARLAWEAGEVLTPGQTERALRLAATQLPRMRLQVLARGVLAHLRGSLDVDVNDTRVRHALQMICLVDGNRRGLRRLLARYFAGERDFILHHPASRDWFARHPRVRPEAWLSGPVLRREVPGWGVLTLALEWDALEVLRMGTYVGSCFGLNGIRSESAAAVALDVNKCVLYARDARGAVVARQALALSDQDTLVPFAVYPRSTPPAIESLFLDFDLAFAESLGLPLHEGEEWPDVENILSTSYWHDGAWELVVTPEAKA